MVTASRREPRGAVRGQGGRRRIGCRVCAQWVCVLGEDGWHSAGTGLAGPGVFFDHSTKFICQGICRLGDPCRDAATNTESTNGLRDSQEHQRRRPLPSIAENYPNLNPRDKTRQILPSNNPIVNPRFPQTCAHPPQAFPNLPPPATNSWLHPCPYSVSCPDDAECCGTEQDNGAVSRRGCGSS